MLGMRKMLPIQDDLLLGASQGKAVVFAARTRSSSRTRAIIPTTSTGRRAHQICRSSGSDQPPNPPGGFSSMTAEADDNNNGPPNIRKWLLIIIGSASGAGFTLYSLSDRSSTEATAWQQDTSTAGVTVIIPALNEEKAIAGCISYLQALEPPPIEVIVADGGSSDRTAELAKESGAVVVQSRKGRAVQMNAGARTAKGPLLCFIHADSRPPATLVPDIRNMLGDGRIVMGGFRVIIEHKGKKLHWMTFHQLIKTYYAPLLFRPISFFRGLRAMFGDQNLFCRKSDFVRQGGYDETLPIMEDLDLLMRLHYAGPSPQHSIDVQAGQGIQNLYRPLQHLADVQERMPSKIGLRAQDRERLSRAIMQEQHGSARISGQAPSSLEMQEFLAAASSSQGLSASSASSARDRCPCTSSSPMEDVDSASGKAMHHDKSSSGAGPHVINQKLEMSSPADLLENGLPRLGKASLSFAP